MAFYNKIKLLSQLVATDPARTEDASKLAPAIRQLKDFLKTFLAVSIDDDGTLKASAVTGSALADQSVNGTSANTAGTAGKIQQGTVSRPDLRNNAVDSTKLEDLAATTAKINDLAVTTGKLADLAVTTAKIADTNVTTGKLANLAVTAAKLDSDAVETAKIKDANVTNAKLAAAAVTPDKFSNVGAAKVIVGDGTSAVAAAIGGDVTASLVAGVLTFVLNSTAAEATNYAKVAQKVSSGTAGGGSTAGSYVARTTNWSLISGSVVSIVAGRIRFATAGSYIVNFHVVGYSIGAHKAKLVLKGTPDSDLIVGNTVIAGAGVQNDSTVRGLIEIPAANSDCEIQHWAEITHANGFGYPATAGDEETYIVGEIIKVA